MDPRKTNGYRRVTAAVTPPWWRTAGWSERGVLLMADWYSVAKSCYFLAVQIASLCTSSTLKPVCINAHLQAASLQRRPFFGWCFQTWTSSSWFWPGFWVEKVHSNGILTAKIEEPWSTGDLSALKYMIWLSPYIFVRVCFHCHKILLGGCIV